MKGMRKVWKESASLLLLSKKTAEPSSKFNYDILAFKRSTGSKFMPSAIVFPGGVIEKADSARSWLDLFAKQGVADSRLKDLRSVHNTSDFIYQKSSEEEQIERELSLRISAIRETFEEVGILLAKNAADLQKDSSGLLTTAHSDFDTLFWQKEVLANPARFYDLCQSLQVVPDVFSLHAWSNWMTPTTVGKHRFDAIFFVACLPERPGLWMDEKEAQDVFWASPDELLATNGRREIWLPPPQIYELRRLSQVKEFEQLAKFAKWRNQFGTTLFYPVQYPVKDKQLVDFLPGDDLYPTQPNYYEVHADMDAYLEKTADELLVGCQKLHRTNHATLHKGDLLMNVVPANEHLCPLGEKNSIEDFKVKAKL